MSATFSFAHVWRVDADPDVVFGVLADVDRYPQWWPQVRSVERIDESSGRAVVRSLLPYSLRVVMSREIEDPASGVLRVGLSGDLVGFAQFTIPRHCESGPVDVDYRQVVDLTAPSLRPVAGLFGPALRANHTFMMRGGESGLRQRCRERRGH